jgi:acetyltransferase-like isoleucine patch superfamily enzyme
MLVVVTGPTIVRMGPGAAITGNGRITLGSGGTKGVFDAQRCRAALWLGGGSVLHVAGRSKIAYGAILRVPDDGELRIGDGVHINALCQILGGRSVSIGDDTVLGTGARILGSNDHATSQDGGTTWTDPWRSVVIGAGCWLGYESLVLPGVEIGDGAVVAARAVVTKDVAPGSLVGGNPARVLRTDIRWRP